MARIERSAQREIDNPTRRQVSVETRNRLLQAAQRDLQAKERLDKAREAKADVAAARREANRMEAAAERAEKDFKKAKRSARIERFLRFKGGIGRISRETEIKVQEAGKEMVEAVALARSKAVYALSLGIQVGHENQDAARELSSARKEFRSERRQARLERTKDVAGKAGKKALEGVKLTKYLAIGPWEIGKYGAQKIADGARFIDEASGMKERRMYHRGIRETMEAIAEVQKFLAEKVKGTEGIDDKTMAYVERMVALQERVAELRGASRQADKSAEPKRIDKPAEPKRDQSGEPGDQQPDVRVAGPSSDAGDGRL